MKMLRNLVFGVLSLSAASSFSENTSKLDPADISFLLPIPSEGAIKIGLANAGDLGEIMSRENFKKLPIISEMHTDLDSAYDNAFVSAFRIDPCAKVSVPADSDECDLAVIRIVVQIFENGNVVDSGMHLVYALGKTVPEGVVAGLTQLKNLSSALDAPTEGAPIGLHPAFKDEASSQKFGTAVQGLLSKVIGARNHILMSVMGSAQQENGEGTIWSWQKVPFIGLNPADGSFVGRVFTENDPEYAAIIKTKQVDGTLDGTHLRSHFTTSLSPVSAEAKELNSLLTDDIETNNPLDFPAGYDQALKIENPRKFNIPQVDCASCHISTAIRLHAESEFDLVVDSQERYEMPEGISVKMSQTAKDNMLNRNTVVINFGYMDNNKPAISDRTVNETAEALKSINK